jgi:uncharacterized protein (UPF0333 family)
MKLSFKQKNALRLIVLLVLLAGIIVFIYFQLKDENNKHLDMNNLENELSSKDKNKIKNNVNEAGGLKVQQYAANGALRNNDKITINEILKIHSLNNE